MKAVGDGKRVNIPVPLDGRLTEGGTKKGSQAGCWISRFKPVGGWRREIRAAIQTLRGDVESPRLTKLVIPCFLEKPRRESDWRPYRKPTQVGG